jgi:hypothetical protein
MGGLLVCAARFLASAALCQYSSDRDDMQDEHWKDTRFLRFTEPCEKCGVGQLVTTRPNPVRRGKSRPAVSRDGSGRLDDPLTRTLTTEQEYPVILEYAKASFGRIKQRLRHLSLGAGPCQARA